MNFNDIKELAEFINNNFPNDGTEINIAISLLNETIANLSNKILNSLSSYDKSVRGMYFNNSQNLENIIETLNDIAICLTRNFDLPDSEEDDEIDVLLDSELDSEKKVPIQENILKKLNINYNDINLYVDTSKEHNLYEDFTHKRPCAFAINYNNKENKIEATQWKELLVKTCEFLYNNDKKSFVKIILSDPNLKGSSRIWFSANKSEIVSPQKIDNSGVYVLGNLSANGARDLLKKLLHSLKIPTMNYKVYLRKDLSSLHNKTGVQLINNLNTENTSTDEIADESEQKIGKYAVSVFKKIFKEPISKEELANMQDKEWSHDNLGIRYPLLKKYVTGVSIKEQTKYKDSHSRYYKDIFLVNNKQYFLCSQWFEEFRPKLDNWLILREYNSNCDTEYKIKNSIIIKENILRVLLIGFLNDFNENEIINIANIRNEYDKFIKSNTEYKSKPERVIYALVKTLIEAGLIELAPNCQKGKYIIKYEKKFEKIIKTPNNFFI
jgi:hypothetical protein